MNSRKIISLLVFLLLATYMIGVPIPESNQENEREKEAIAKVIRDSIAWALTKNRELQESTMAKDENLFYFWTHSNSSILGWDEHVKLFKIWMDPRFKATHTEVRDLRINLSRSGDVAWYSAMLDDLGEWDGKALGDKDIRWTGVLEKRDGKWVIVQMHASLAADKVLEQAKKDKKDSYASNAE
jgi:ketosteroid isomerase-like protein